jgi:hypothetical protein
MDMHEIKKLSDQVEGYQESYLGKIKELQEKKGEKSELDFFYNCEECGQSLDTRDLTQVLRHHVPGHEPIPNDA